jgi:hypothetical protein
MVGHNILRIGDVFLPGKYHITAIFSEFKTIEKDIELPIGEGPYIIELEVIKLVNYELRISKRYMDDTGGISIDGIKYNLEIYADGARVEQHHILDLGCPGGERYIDYYAPQKTQIVRCACGFYYDDLPIKGKPRFKDLYQIDVDRLIKHLQALSVISSATEGEMKVLESLSFLLKKPDEKKKLLKAQNLTKLICYLRSRDFAPNNDLKETIMQEILSADK